MNILIEIGHPAHVHFFRHAIDIWHHHDHRLLVVSREKEMTNYLLKAFGIDAVSLSRAGSGLVGLFSEMLQRDWKLFKLARTFKPDIMTSIGGTWISQVGKLRNVPTIVFYDTENATLSNAITYPLLSLLCTPRCYQKDTGLGTRHLRYPGYHELAYLHPSRFTPDRSILDKLGVKPWQRYFVLRFIAWGASHDLTETGIAEEDKIQLVDLLSEYGKVFITSEQELPENLSPYCLQIAPEEIHHLMAFATMVIGESATMASEAAVLGVPAVFISDTSRGYIEDQESLYGLVYRYTNEQLDECRSKILELLRRENLEREWQMKRTRMLRDTIDVTGFVVDLVSDFPKAVARYRHMWSSFQERREL